MGQLRAALIGGIPPSIRRVISPTVPVRHPGRCLAMSYLQPAKNPNPEKLQTATDTQETTAIPSMLGKIERSLSVLAEAAQRIADKLDPPPDAIVDTNYVKKRMGLKTTTRIAQMAQDGTIPARCIVDGTGNGKPWKFHRKHIDEWIESDR